MQGKTNMTRPHCSWHKCARNSQDKWQSQHMFLWSYKDLWLRYFTLFLPRIFCFLGCLVVGLILRNLTKVKFLKLSQGKLVRLKVGIRFSVIFRPFWAEATNKKMLTFWWCQHNFSCFLIFSNKQGKEESGKKLMQDPIIFIFLNFLADQTAP